jgi:hypothetical protein
MNLLDQIKQYTSGKKYASSNLQLSDGSLAYVTSTGVVKKYASEDDYNNTIGKHHCPSNQVTLDKSWDTLGFPVGSLMVAGQSCGHEASYVQTLPPENNFDWQFYIQNNPDLNLTTEQQAMYHWTTTGQKEGRLPNATILTSMSTLGKVGYIDADATFHSVPPTYDGNYNTYNAVSNVTGKNMVDCTKKRPPVNYGDQLTIQHKNVFGFMNKSSNLEFGSTTTNFFIRPPVNASTQTGNVHYGDEISITSSSSSQTDDCGWWGCKVANVNSVTKMVEFGPGGNTAYTFQIIPPRGSNYKIGDSIKYGDPFTLMAMISNVNDTLDQGNSLTAGKTLVSENGKYIMIYQTDGNLCLYSTSGGSSIWCSKATHTPGKLKLQSDGNLVAYDSGNIPKWSTKTANKGSGPFKLTIQNDRNIVLSDADDKILWKTNTTLTDTGSSKQETPYFAYVAKSMMMVGLWKTSKQSNTFSFVSSVEYKEECDLLDLQNLCSITTDCTGFVHSPSTNSWQMITPESSESDYTITNTSQDIYLKKASVNLNDSSCTPDKVKFIDSAVFSNYPVGHDFKLNKSHQCDVIQPIDLTTYTEQNASMYAKTQKYVQRGPSSLPDVTHQSQQTNAQMSKKTQEYQNVLSSIQTLKPSTTLSQQESDLEIVDAKNKRAAILWGLIAMIILAIIMFRPK